MGLHPLKYSLISDMHINHPQPKTPYDKLEEIVVVAGDTSNGLDGLRFLQKLRNKGHTVIAVDGNHEHYSNVSQERTIAETTERFDEEYPAYVVYDDVLFLSVNGWYVVDTPEHWFSYMNDGRYAVGPDAFEAAKEVTQRAFIDEAFLRTALREAEVFGMKAVVTTHTAPSEDTLDPRYAGSFSNLWYYNPQMTEVMKDFKDTILVWNHGHTHAPADKMVNGVRVVANPRGYPGENKNWEPKTVEIDL